MVVSSQLLKMLNFKKIIASVALVFIFIFLNNIEAQANCNPRSPQYEGDCVCLGIDCPIDDWIPYLIVGVAAFAVFRLKTVPTVK